MPITIRTPSTHPSSSSSPSIPHPKLQWLTGTWHVTHSTLPMWKSARNVRITYTVLPGTSPPHLDDLVTYQKLKSPALKSVHGVDKPFQATPAPAPSTTKDDAAADATTTTTTTTTTPEGDAETASLGYNWRGKGWLMIASSKWEIIGFSDEEGSHDGNQWVVTYFAKTLFTPAGIDIYSRKGPLKSETVEGIKAGLAGLGGDLAKLAEGVFEITRDRARDD